MTLQDWVVSLTDKEKNTDAVGFAILCMTSGSPTVVSSMPLDATRKLVEIVNTGEFLTQH